MEKQSFRGPIAAIARIFVGDKPLLLWGAGGVLHGWSESNHSEVSLRVFDSHNIHGIKPTEPSETGLCQLIVFGDKSLAFLKASEDGSSLVIISQERCDDLVLDCRLLRQEKAQDDVLIVGYAHNMIDIRHPRWPEKSELLRRVLCPHPSVLFALNIFGCLDDGCLVVASGTVFGNLYIWQCDLEEKTSQTPDSHFQGSIVGQAKRHEGVIFRIVWSTRGDKLITVSDDRTVRLWTYDRSNGNQVGSGLSQRFEGWDHISRLWDAVFVGDNEEEVATCSEDGTVRLWNQIGQCTTVLVGHIDSVWRLLAIDDYLVTVGNDSAVKFWYLDHHRVCCPRLEGSTVMDMSIPSWELSPEAEEVAQEGDEEEGAPQRRIYKSSSHANRRVNGVNSVFFSSCGDVIVLVLIDGMIWVVKAADSDYLWERVVHLEQTVVTADVHVSVGNTGANAEELLTMQVVVSFLDCTAAFLAIQGESNMPYQIVRRIDWKPHDYKCVNVWLVPVSLSLERDVLVCSATMKGICRVWGLNEESCSMGLLAEMGTMKQEIVSAVLFHATMDQHFIVLGDSRGGVGVYAVKKSSKSWDVSNVKYFHRIHGSDPVSALASSSLSGFVSVGHDGVMNFFEYQGGFWFHCNTLNIHPISTPDFLSVAKARQNDSNETSIIVGGYHGSSYIVRDVYHSYQLLRVEGGGWKRPHKCAVNFPDNCKLGRNTLPTVQFVCPVPVGKNQTHLQLFGSRRQSNAKVLYPLQLNGSCFGRVSYSSAIVPAPREEDSILAVGGEDCTMKVFNLSNLELLQETTLSKNASLKSLHSCGNSNSSNNGSNKACSRGIVLGGGGKLLYYLWSYDFTCNDEGCEKMRTRRVPLRKICEGSVWPNATQDHRILAVRCLYLGVTSQPEAVHHYGLFLTDSRGILTILKFQHSFECCELRPSAVSRLFEVEVSDCPLLSCSSLLLQPFRMEDIGIQTIVCCVGDTKGAVHTLALPLQTSSAG